MTNFKEMDLPNGLKLIVDPFDSVETVTFLVYVKCGSRMESKEMNGISHFLEHMAFKGTKTRDAMQIAKEFDDIGGRFNAYTSWDSTVYYAKVLKEYVAEAVNIIADILQNSQFDEEEIDKERGVILQEMARSLDSPDNVVHDHFMEIAYPNQPLGRTILGDANLIKTIKKKDFVNYVDKNYGVNNIIVAAAGNCDPEYIQDLVNKEFVNIKPPSQTKMDVAKYAGGYRAVEKDLEQVHFLLGFEGVDYNHDSFYIQSLASIVLGGGMSSRLFQEVREKRGLAYSVYSYAYSLQDTGLFSIALGTGADTVNQSIDVIAEECQKVANEISEEELERAKAQVRADILMSQESTQARASRLASHMVKYGHVKTLEEVLHAIMAVRKEEVYEFMKKYIINAKPTIASLGNVSKIYKYEDILKRFAA